MSGRRYTIHPPQLVGRLGVPRQDVDARDSIRKLVGEYDAAMNELQRFLKYLADANDSAQTGAGITGVAGGAIDHHLLANLTVGDDHTQYLKEKAAGGAAAEIPLHHHTGASDAGVVAASSVSFAPAGSISSTNVQAAIEELDATVGAGGGEVMAKVSLGF